ncbi:heme A synthase [Paenibacillus sp. J31TS4]|uniref:COX15/CtaA family protein n=1 Tax=Paenibacillus sp. J31TS4 TaxID=2807195 RepID=UPI001B00F35C|nr:COX15/CtaA family protein [Paenibacillus sp. J31TS4]GIP40735.1 heme A synthase [Paenibacillus sp. J31TS4]
MKGKWLRALSTASAIGMFIVLLMGALVTKTESGRGCGDDWPLCNGKFIPSYTIESMIEYSHRFVTALEGILVLAAFIGVLIFVKRKDAFWYATTALAFTVIQALMGAAAVIWPQSSAVLALHFGISLVAVASSLLLAIVLWNPEKVPQTFDEAAAAESRGSAAKLASFHGPTVGLRAAVWLTTIYSVVVVYIGAYIKHTDSGGACSGFPLCNGELIPALSGGTGAVFSHRVAAMLLVAMVILLVVMTRRTGVLPEFAKWANWSLAFVLLQGMSGVLVTFAMGTEWYLFMALLHTVWIAGLFSVLCFLSVRMIQLNPDRRQGSAYRRIAE